MSRLPLLCLVLLAACGADAASSGKAKEAEPATPPLPPGARTAFTLGTTTRLEIRPSTVSPGEQFVVRFEIRNDAQDTLRLTQSCSAPARVAIRLASAPEGSAALETTTCEDKVTSHAVPPNAAVVLQFPTRAAAKSQPLQSGLYVLEATPTVTEANGQPFSISPVTTELRVR